MENPARLVELNPVETLKKIGIGKKDVICDIGAGSGIFAIPSPKMTDSTVFALDINQGTTGHYSDKAKKENLINIKPTKVNAYNYDIEAESVDIVMMVTVCHEIEDKDALLTEIKRILKKAGKLVIIEFHKMQTPLGPRNQTESAKKNLFHYLVYMDLSLQIHLSWVIFFTVLYLAFLHNTYIPVFY